MMSYDASKIFNFGNQTSWQIQAASTDINELDVGCNELEGNGFEDEKSLEFSFLTEICTELSKQNMLQNS